MKAIKNALCKWLGIWDLEYRVEALKASVSLQDQWIGKLQTKVAKLESARVVQEEALKKVMSGSVRATGAPDYPPTRSEYRNGELYNMAVQAWEARVRESDRIGEEALKRLGAEDAARRHSAPLEEPDADL